MAFTPVEIIALVLVVVGLIKILVILISPNSWLNFAKKAWGKPVMMKVVSLILLVLVFYYLIQELTVVQILATAAFVSLLLAVELAPRLGPILSRTKKISVIQILKQSWLTLLIWIILLLWGIKELFI